MRIKILLIILLVSCKLSAQLTIKAGAQLTVAGNLRVTLQDFDLINDGNFSAGNGITSFTGNKSSSIRGSQLTQFFELDLKKSNDSFLFLQHGIGITNRVLFASGYLDLNGFNADLGTTGKLDSEQEKSRVIGLNGGQVMFTTTLNAPLAANPGNLGAIISSGQNLGSVIIKRGHQPQQGSGLVGSIQRYYDITPVNNKGLNAVLGIEYFDGELNLNSEGGLVFFKSRDTVHWADLGFTTADPSINYVEKVGVDTFMRLTLAINASLLPVNFVSFDAKCERNTVLLNWTATGEQDHQHYKIQKSGDGTSWVAIGDLPVAANGGTSTYSFTDNNPLQNGYYRIAQYNVNGTVHYSAVAGTSCNLIDAFTIWPNPAHNEVLIKITGNSESAAVINVYDSKGALVVAQKANLTRGINQLRLDIGRLANGIYSLVVEWENGRMKKTVEVMKQ